MDKLKSKKNKKLIKNNCHHIKKLFDTPIENKQLMLDLLLINPFSILYASKKLLQEKDLIYIAMSGSPFSFTLLPNKLKNDKQFIIDVLNSYLHPKLKGAVTFSFLEFVSSAIKDDKEFMKYMIEDYYDNSTVSKYFSKRLLANKNYILSLKRFNLADLSEALRNDKNIIEHLLTLDKDYYCWFKGAGDEIRKDGKLILKCFSSSLDTRMLKDIDKSLFRDKSFIKKLYKIKSLVNINDIDKKLLNNKEFIKELILIDPEIIWFASKELKKDRELVIFCINAIKNDGDNTFGYFKSFKYFFKNKKIVYSLIKKGMSLEGMGDESFKINREFVIEFVKHNGANLQFASEELQNDIELQKIAKNSRLANI